MSNTSPRILGIDPGLVRTGWGVISVEGNNIKYIACGVIKPDTELPMAERLAALHAGIAGVIAEHQPHEAAIEETFVNVNGATTLKLGQARGALLLSLALAGLPVAEYAARLVKKSVVGTGKAEKTQIQMMIRTLLPGSATTSADAADALAVALCHAHHAGMRQRIPA